MEDTQPEYKLIDLQPLVSSLYEKIFAGKFLSYHLHSPLFFWWYVRGSFLSAKEARGPQAAAPFVGGAPLPEYGCLMTEQENAFVKNSLPYACVLSIPDCHLIYSEKKLRDEATR